MVGMEMGLQQTIDSGMLGDDMTTGKAITKYLRSNDQEVYGMAAFGVLEWDTQAKLCNAQRTRYIFAYYYRSYYLLSICRYEQCSSD